ncbi:hypothetical protein K491DRAFT_349391 [Lophiostoma macrostomum CBS 122681]|uniref:Uncharacterized protein n=1 Tax=Lophiostoma macrostomum CBS 122681 TaxID=1314788 RepID=A0A6A6TDW2_9PLEO|nr:hypothetical protein K491DRAFT_349391 [Lophiostoma macrostomum CBS 122681]
MVSDDINLQLKSYLQLCLSRCSVQAHTIERLWLDHVMPRHTLKMFVLRLWTMLQRC